MRPEFTQFSMVPFWVMDHPAVKGDGTRLAVYAAIRRVAYLDPDRDWRSDRTLAIDVSEYAGVSAERCRKHIAALRDAGIITGGTGRLLLPSDAPNLGHLVGHMRPSSGSDATHGGSDATQHPLKEPESSLTTPNGVVGGDDPGSPETRPEDVAKAITDGYWTWVEQQSGHPPQGIRWIALRNVITPFIGTHEPKAIKDALVVMYREARPITRAVLEATMDGRTKARRPRGSMDDLRDFVARGAPLVEDSLSALRRKDAEEAAAALEAGDA